MKPFANGWKLNDFAEIRLKRLKYIVNLTQADHVNANIFVDDNSLKWFQSLDLTVDNYPNRLVEMDDAGEAISYGLMRHEQVVGTCFFYLGSTNEVKYGVVELCFLIHQNFRGRGFVNLAIIAMGDIAFSHGMSAIKMLIEKENITSQRVVHRLNIPPSGSEIIKFKDRCYSFQRYFLTIEEWPKIRSKLVKIFEWKQKNGNV